MDGLPATNALDQHAYVHDMDYEEASTHKQVRHADNVFIKGAGKINTKMAKVANAAIRIKRGAEDIFGPIYPTRRGLGDQHRLLNKNRYNPEEIAGPLTKAEINRLNKNTTRDLKLHQ